MLYAILAESVPAELLGFGVQGAPLTLLAAGDTGLWALVSPLPDATRALAPEVADALDYDRVLRELHARVAVLPVRYGSILGSEAEVVALLREKQADYQLRLTQLAGCDEFGVRALLLPPAGAAVAEDSGQGASSGAAYLRARQRCYKEDETLAAQAAELSARLGVAFADLVRAQLTQQRPVPPHERLVAPPAISVSFLVPREHALAFRSLFGSLKRSESQPMWLCGPWPPYSFAAAALS
jgi:hypothetical protein